MTISEPRVHEALVDLRQVVEILRHYLLALIILPTIFAVAAVYFAMQEPPRFRASTVLHINPQPFKAVREIQDPYNPGYGTDEYYNTQQFLIRSRTQIEKLVTALSLDEHDEFTRIDRPWYRSLLNWRKWAAKLEGTTPPPPRPRTQDAKYQTAVGRAYAAALAYRVPGSNIFYVQFASEDRKLAAEAANKLADLYIEATLQARLDATRKAVGWINDRLVDVSDELSNSEKRLQGFREQENLVNVGGARGLLEEELKDLSARLRTAERQTNELTSASQQIELARSNPETLSDVSSLLLDAVVKSAASTYLDAQRNLRQLERRYGARHPQMESAEVRLNAARDAYYEQMQIKAQGLKSELSIAIESKRKLSNDVARVRQRIEDLDRKEYQLNLLSRDVRTNQQIYDLFLSRVKETETQANYDEINARIVDTAKVPGAPFEPEVQKRGILWGLAGLLITILLIALRESLRSKIESPQDLEHLTLLPTLGMIPTIKMAARSRSPAKYFAADPKSPFADAIRSVKTAVSLSDVDRQWKCIAITSAVPKEGKTTTCSALAAAFAANEKVLLIDADLRRCSLGPTMGIKKSQPGLTDLLNETSSLEECIHVDAASGVAVLPAGTPPANPAQVLASKGFQVLLESLRERYDRIIFDTPPTNATSDILILLNRVDAVLVIARAEMTRKAALQHSLKQLATLGAPIVGVVLNDTRMRGRGQVYGNYGYYGRY